MTDTDDVLISREGRLGRIVLNRPRAINALTHPMVVSIQTALDAWADDPEVATVVLTGAGDRGLCAGGDIVSIYRDAVAGSDGAIRFWQDEYVLNATIAEYPKPFVAIMDGIVLGGGIGLAAHASHRVVTETSSLGLPEVTIGFVPDVGGTWLLSRAPGELGTHLALTGGSATAGDAIALGLADSFVPRDQLPEVFAALQRGENVLSIEPPASTLDRGWIDDAYAGDDVGVILERLRAGGHDGVADTIGSKSPTSLALTLASLRRAADLNDLRAVLAQEFRVSSRVLRTHDLAEGIRAQVIDKDRTPHWQPATLAEVGSVDEFFAPLPGGEWVPPRGRA